MLLVKNLVNTTSFNSRPIRYPHIKRSDIKVLLDSGKSNLEIAQILNVDYDWLNNSIRRFGLISAKQLNANQKTKEIANLYNQGFNKKEIYSKTKYSHRLIEKVITNINEKLKKKVSDKELLEQIMKKLNIKSDNIIL